MQNLLLLAEWDDVTNWTDSCCEEDDEEDDDENEDEDADEDTARDHAIPKAGSCWIRTTMQIAK